MSNKEKDRDPKENQGKEENKKLIHTLKDAPGDQDTVLDLFDKLQKKPDLFEVEAELITKRLSALRRKLKDADLDESFAYTFILHWGLKDPSSS
jgi:hypothetical protein